MHSTASMTAAVSPSKNYSNTYNPTDSTNAAIPQDFSDTATENLSC